MALAPSAGLRTVVIGAGFGGLAFIKAAKHPDFDITLIDSHNFHTFSPLLYQVASAGLTAESIAHPARAAIRNRKAKFLLDTVLDVEFDQNRVVLASGERVEYDKLIIAAGSTTADFGVKGVKEFTLGMKSIDEALIIRSKVMRALEDAARYHQQPVPIVIVGGGPTGVELAGALAELSRVLHKDFPELGPAPLRVTLVEAGETVLSMFPKSLSLIAIRDLKRRGVTVLTNAQVAEVTKQDVTLKGGRLLNSELTIWTAGVKGNVISSLLTQRMDIAARRDDRILVDEHCRPAPTKYPNVHVIGDLAAYLDEAEKPLPMVAPVAMQMGRHVAKFLIDPAAAGFKYKDKGAMATIGRSDAVVAAKGLKLSGFIAWLAWLGLHLAYLLGGRNKLQVVIDWAWNYLTYDRTARQILR
jgi:NADH:ubiquinone reductase (H+-translocating)